MNEYAIRCVPRLALAAAAVLATAPLAARAELTGGAALATTSGTYGKPTRTRETALQVFAGWRGGPWRASAEMAIKNVRGAASAATRDEEAEPDEEAVPPPAPIVARAQSGAAELTLGAWYTVLDDRVTQLRVEGGGKIKLPLASGSNCLLTNGAVDVSVEARARRPFGPLEGRATLGWTRRGDPIKRDDDCVPTGGRTDLRNPLYTQLGVRWPAGPLRLGVDYAYRQPLRAGRAPKRELEFGAGTRERWAGWELGARLTLGLSDASPDYGVTVSAERRF